MVNIFGSIIVNMTAVPSKGYKGQTDVVREKKSAEQIDNETVYYCAQNEEIGMSEDLESNVSNVPKMHDSDTISLHKPSTFVIQTLFFLLKMMENFISLVGAILLLSCTTTKHHLSFLLIYFSVMFIFVFIFI